MNHVHIRFLTCAGSIRPHDLHCIQHRSAGGVWGYFLPYGTTWLSVSYIAGRCPSILVLMSESPEQSLRNSGDSLPGNYPTLFCPLPSPKCPIPTSGIPSSSHAAAFGAKLTFIFGVGTEWRAGSVAQVVLLVLLWALWHICNSFLQYRDCCADQITR